MIDDDEHLQDRMLAHIPFDAILTASAAAGEATRLRLLALLAEAELTVSELVMILGQSQPRISRHLPPSGTARRPTTRRWSAGWASWDYSG